MRFRQLREDVLKPIIAEVLKTDKYDEAVFSEKIEHIEVEGATLHFHSRDGKIISRQWENQE